MNKFRANKQKPIKSASISVNVNKGGVKGGLSRVVQPIKQKGK